MIINSQDKLEIGKIYNHESNNCFLHVKGKAYKEFTFYVIRETSEEEYIEYAKTQGTLNNGILYKNFYQISMD